MNDPEKTCSKCLLPLPLSSFYSTGHWCIQCQKDKVTALRQRKIDAGLTIKGELPLWRIKAQASIAGDEPELTKSEIAIERERHKRRVEKEIALRLQPEPATRKEDFDRSVSPWAGLCGPVREAKQTSVGWFCPVGVCSVTQ